MRVLLLSISFALVGCSGGPSADPEAPTMIRLSDLFTAEQVQDAVEVVPAERSEWKLAELAELAELGELSDEGWRWRAAAGVADVRVEGDALRGRTRGERAVIEFTAPAPLGAGDRLHAIEVRLEVSEGDTLALTVLDDDGPPTEAFAAPGDDGPPLGLKTPLTPGEGVKSYRFDLSRSLALGPFSRRSPRRVVLRPSTVDGAEFAIESVRLIFRDEHYASVASGLGWHGLGEVWREALVSRPGERLVIPLTVPVGQAVLDLALGTPVDTPMTFVIEALSAAGESRRLAKRTITQRDRWERERIDLGDLAGRSLELSLRVEAEDAGAVALWGSGKVAMRYAGAAAATAERPQGVVLIVADTLRKDHLDAWGYERPTAPTLSRLAAGGVRFEDAVSQAVWTKVSVPSILTGLYPPTHGIIDIPDRLPAAATTLAESFRAAGYATMATSSWSFTGQLTNLHQGVDVLWEGGSIDLPDDSETKTARFFVDQALEFIEDHRDLPFMVVLHLGDPHSPYRPLGAYADLWTEPGANERHAELLEKILPEIESDFYRRMKLPQQSDLERAGFDLEWWRDHEIDWYDASIKALDAEIQRLIDRLDHLGLDQRVVFGFIADHGEEFFEHGHNWHGANLYGYQTDVPLMLWGPGYLPAGVTVPVTVQSIDLHPTLLDLAGIAPPDITQGRSLLPLIAAVQSGEDPAASGFRPGPAFVQHIADDDSPGVPDGMQGESWAVVDGRWRFVHNAIRAPDDPEFELYDRQVDALSMNDVAAEHPEVVERMAGQLREWRQWVDERKLDTESTDELSAAELERLRSLGYI